MDRSRIRGTSSFDGLCRYRRRLLFLLHRKFSMDVRRLWMGFGIFLGRKSLRFMGANLLHGLWWCWIGPLLLDCKKLISICWTLECFAHKIYVGGQDYDWKAAGSRSFPFLRNMGLGCVPARGAPPAYLRRPYSEPCLQRSQPLLRPRRCIAADTHPHQSRWGYLDIYQA